MRGVLLFEKNWIKHIKFYFHAFYYLWTNIWNFMLRHMSSYKHEINNLIKCSVVTLAFAKVQIDSEARKLHFMFLIV
jgi:hypothetical protein